MGVILFFSETHTQYTGRYKYGSLTKAWGRWNPGGLVLYQTSRATSIRAESRPIPGDSKEDGGKGGPWFLVLYQEEWVAVFQVEGDPIPGNSQRCDARHKFTRRQRRWSLIPGVIPGGLGQRWSKQMAARFQEIPSGVTLGTNSPDGGNDLIYTSNSRRRWCDWESVIYTRVAWVTAIT